MNTLILLLTVIVYLLISLAITDGDILFPTSIVMVMYILSTIFFISEMTKWDGDISQKTLLLFIVGLTVYLVTSVIVVKVFSKIYFFKRSVPHNLETASSDKIQFNLPKVDEKITFVIDVYLLFALLKYYLDVRNSSASVASFSSFSEMIGNYRNAGAYGKGQITVSLSTISNYNFLIMTALGYVYMAFVVQYLVAKKKTNFQWKILNWAPIIIYALCTFLTGGRTPLIQLIVAFAVMYYLKYIQSYGKVNFNLKRIFQFFLIGVISLWAFSSARTIVGRTETSTTWDYLAMYIGAPIKLFDKYLTSSQLVSHQYIGQETFPYLWISFFGKSIPTWSNLEFRSTNSGVNLGNVYTAFRRYYSDFGLSGLIILTSLESLFYSFFYIKLSHKSSISKEIDFTTLLYSFFAIGPVYYSVDDRLFPYYIAKDRILIIVMMFIFSKFLSHVRFVVKKTETL